MRARARVCVERDVCVEREAFLLVLFSSLFFFLLLCFSFSSHRRKNTAFWCSLGINLIILSPSLLSKQRAGFNFFNIITWSQTCLLYTSDAADER